MYAKPVQQIESKAVSAILNSIRCGTGSQLRTSCMAGVMWSYLPAPGSGIQHHLQSTSDLWGNAVEVSQRSWNLLRHRPQHVMPHSENRCQLLCHSSSAAQHSTFGVDARLPSTCRRPRPVPAGLRQCCAGRPTRLPVQPPPVGTQRCRTIHRRFAALGHSQPMKTGECVGDVVRAPQTGDGSCDSVEYWLEAAVQVAW